MNYRSPIPSSRAFWRKYRHLVLVAPDGTLRLTSPGRQRFGELLVSHGLSADSAIEPSMFARIAQTPRQLPAGLSRESLLTRLSDARLSPYERSLLAQVLGLSQPDALTDIAPVVEMDEWRSRRAA